MGHATKKTSGTEWYCGTCRGEFRMARLPSYRGNQRCALCGSFNIEQKTVDVRESVVEEKENQ